MDFVIIILKTFFIYLLVAFIFRIMGKRELGQLGTFDLVVFILIAELVAISIENKENFFFNLVPVIILVILQILISRISLKNIKFRRFIDGKPVIIIKKGGKKYQKGYKLMYYAYKFLIVDPTGLKKKIYRWIDKWTPKKEGIYENYNSHITNINTSIFNLEHKLWYNPWDNTITSRESFFDLYEKAKKTCLTLFEATEQFMKDQITETEYKKVLQDKSYTTGFSWKIKKEMKYLEF